MRRARPIALVLTCLAGPALLVGPAPADAAKRPIRLAGGAVTTGPFCNASVPFNRVATDGAVQAVAAAARTKQGRRSRKGTRISVEKCANGSWSVVSRAALGTRRTAKRLRLPTTKASTGDYRVRVVDRRSRQKGGSSYVRIGVGEIVDTPVTFLVVNRNRTALPCLNAPDDGAYAVKGTITAPRAVLAGSGAGGRGPDLALYLHGLGYGGFFWRYQGEPGYDYALEQVYAGHASVVIDRLGYRSSRGPADGNRICYQGHADIADQIIGQLRAGRYTSGDGRPVRAGRVALVGHSAGSLIALTTQSSFRSADALALTGFNSLPAALAVTQLGLGSADCAVNPVSGPPGTRNYGRFGITDEDFAQAHFFDVAPSVAAKVLRERSTDPCGDLLQAVTTFAPSPLFQLSIGVPTLLASGDRDALFPPGGTNAQATLFTRDPKLVTEAIIADTGHALTLGRSRDRFRRVMDDWLKGNRF